VGVCCQTGIAADKWGMGALTVTVVNGGGVRGLVGLAMAASRGEPRHITLLHFRRDEPGAETRRQHVLRQGSVYEVGRTVVAELPNVRADAQTIKRGTAFKPVQMLVAAIAYGVEAECSELVWPLSVDARHEAVGRVSEQVILLRQITELAGCTPPKIDMPLLELTDRQIIELGEQLGASWELAWSCQSDGEKPCLRCGHCQRRAAAFESAGVVDPAVWPIAGARRR